MTADLQPQKNVEIQQKDVGRKMSNSCDYSPTADQSTEEREGRLRQREEELQQKDTQIQQLLLKDEEIQQKSAEISRLQREVQRLQVGMNYNFYDCAHFPRHKAICYALLQESLLRVTQHSGAEQTQTVKVIAI